VDRQIKIFGCLFLYALTACAVVVLGKLIKWSLPTLPINAGDLSTTIDLSMAFPVILTFLFTFLGLRSVAFIGGILNILSLTTSIAEDEARLRDRERDRSAVDELAAYKLPESYRTRIDLPH
jgi:hypothetical protein